MLIIYRHCGPLYRNPNAVNENLLEVTHKFCKVIEHKNKYTKPIVPSCYQQTTKTKLKCQN